MATMYIGDIHFISSAYRPDSRYNRPQFLKQTQSPAFGQQQQDPGRTAQDPYQSARPPVPPPPQTLLPSLSILLVPALWDGRVLIEALRIR